jgi:hypothetical protein
MKEYAALGIDTFILSGYPHLEEAYRVAELLFPAPRSYDRQGVSYTTVVRTVRRSGRE